MFEDPLQDVPLRPEKFSKFSLQISLFFTVCILHFLFQDNIGVLFSYLFKKEHQRSEVFIAKFAEIQLNFIGTSQIIKKTLMMQKCRKTEENREKIRKNKLELDLSETVRQKSCLTPS